MATPSVRLMVYKNYKKNIHRAIKCRADRKKQQLAENQKDEDGPGDVDQQDDPWLKVNQHTLQVGLGSKYLWNWGCLLSICVMLFCFKYYVIAICC